MAELGSINSETEMKSASEVDGVVSEPNKAGGAPYRVTSLDNYFTAYEAKETTPVDIVVIGDSISISNCILGESSYPYILESILNNQPYNKRTKTGWRTASGNDDGQTQTNGGVPGLLTADGTDDDSGSGGHSKIMADTDQATYTATMDGVSIVYSKDPSYGDLEIRDGVGGTLLETINCSGTAKSGFVWTSDALSLASHTIEVTSVGANRLEALVAHVDNRASGVRVWNLGHEGWATDDFLADPTTYLDFIENMQPDLVIVATGVNDADETEYVDDVTTLISNINGVASPDFAFWIPYINANFNSDKLAAIRTYIDAQEYARFDSAAVLLDKDFTGGRFQGYGVHPNYVFVDVIAKQGVNLLSGDPINQLARASAGKANVVDAEFTGNFSVKDGKLTVTDFFGSPIYSIYGNGAQPAYGFLPHNISTVFGGIGSKSTWSDGAGVGASIEHAGTTQLRVSDDAGSIRTNTAPVINAQTGTSYTLVLGDQGKQITRSNASASTQTLPQNSDVAIPIGVTIPIINLGAGTVTFQAGTGASIVGTASIAQNERAVMTKISTNGWHIS